MLTGESTTHHLSWTFLYACSTSDQRLFLIPSFYSHCMVVEKAYRPVQLAPCGAMTAPARFGTTALPTRASCLCHPPLALSWSCSTAITTYAPTHIISSAIFTHDHSIVHRAKVTRHQRARAVHKPAADGQRQESRPGRRDLPPRAAHQLGLLRHDRAPRLCRRYPGHDPRWQRLALELDPDDAPGRP